MYDIEKKQYIFKLSNGKTINIFYKDNLGIYISFLGRRNLWLESSPLIRDTCSGFSADMDNNGNLYILYQDSHGNIMRGLFSDGTISTKTVLSSKDPSACDKHLQVLCHGNSVFYFYVLEYSGSRLLSYQLQHGNGSVSTPKVIDYVSDSSVPFTILGNGSIHIFYKSSDSKNPYIGYKRYDPDKDAWSSFKPVSGFSGDTSVLSAVYDNDSSIHLVWQKYASSKYEVMYSCKKESSDKWETEKSIVNTRYPLFDSSLVIVNDILVFYWVKDNIIYYTNTHIGSDFWSSPEKYAFESKALYCMQYKSSPSDEYNNRHYTQLPGNFNSGYKLAFITDEDLKPGAPTFHDVREIFSDTVKILSKSLDEANQRLKDMKSKMEELESRQQQTEMQLSKLGIKTSLIDNEMAKFKTSPVIAPRNENQFRFWEREPAEASPTFAAEPESSGAVKTPVYIPSAENVKEETNIDSAEENNINSQPIMPGTGFASITPEFLKGLSKKTVGL